MGMMSKLKAKWRGDKWAEPSGLEPRDEYGAARWVAEGEGAGATKAALVLGTAVVALSVTCAVLGTVCAVLYMDSSKVRMVAMPQGAGETTVFKATVIDGELQSNATIKQWIIARWIDQWRGVGLDPVDYNRSYFEAQTYMCNSVAVRIAETVKPDSNDPAKLTPEKMLKDGITRRVSVRHVTPRGGEESNAFRLDWTETLYRNSQIVGQADLTADLDLKRFPPQSDAVALQNPYGLYVCSFDWDMAPR
jgi:type IV secretory pathway TrbF-like protein